ESPFQCIFQRQITDLILVFENEFDEIFCKRYTTDLYGYIFKLFKNLKHLSFVGSPPKFFPPLVLHNLPLTTFYSSTLYKLYIHVMYCDDLLALLDGRLKRLNTLNVVIINREYNSTNTYHMNNLPDLKCFHLQYDSLSDTYDRQILPILRRMSNIEALNLHLTIDKQTKCIDGKHMYNEIIMHMSRLRAFNFYFCTFIRLNQSTQNFSNDDILQTFPNMICQKADCMIQYRCFNVKYHLFSLPFMFDYLSFIDNTFPNIIFNHVIRLVLDDGIAFEHEFFMRIASSFPLLKVLHVLNHMPQSPMLNKINSNDNQLYLPVIEYPYLHSLDLELAHHDYAEQFLNDRKVHLPHLTKLTVYYHDLKIVTRNFTNSRTRFNCMKVKQLNLCCKTSIHSEDFYAYFPSL
ncbi:unnamed protein product, partial [Rotaria magnacalcarata]